MKPTNKIERLIEKSRYKASPDAYDKTLHDFMQAVDDYKKQKLTLTESNISRTIMKSKITKIAAATVIIIAVLIGIFQFDNLGSGVVFGEVLEKLSHIQTLHAKLNQNGREVEIWAKRPNMLRREYIDGKYEISNGPKMWIVDPVNEKATLQPSWYFKDAQRRGIDLIDALVQMEYTEGFSGFFSEEPVKQISQNNKTFDLYKMELNQYGDKIKFEALVNSRTQLIHLIKVEIIGQKDQKQFFELTILDYDQIIPAEMFVFEPDGTIEIVVKDVEESEQPITQIEGSTLSGQITWAHSDKPVSGARLSLFGRRGRDSKDKFISRIETGHDGFWKATGVPKGPINISVRSWEFEWPAMPTFSTFHGSPKSPWISVDGQNDYGNLNFKVYKPEDLYARITIDVSYESGKPVEGVNAILQYDDGQYIHQHIYAVPHKKQCSGSNGKFDADDIWPTKRPARIYVGLRQVSGATYATRNAQTEPFVIEPKQTYHFDITLPFVRQMKIQVVDTEGKPLEGISVIVLDKDGTPFFPMLPDASPFEGIITNSDGSVDISGMTPGENIIIAVRYLDSTKPDPRQPLASAYFLATAPLDMSKPLLQITFDKRPIWIEGSAESDSEINKGSIRLMVAGERGEIGIPFLWTRFDDMGRFKFEGVPAGQIRLLCTYTHPEKGRITVEESMNTKPGNRYTITVNEQNIQVVNQRSNH